MLQRQSDIARVRRCVRDLVILIADEDMVEEDGKFYPMMKARRTAEDLCSEREARRTVEDCFSEGEARRTVENCFSEENARFAYAEVTNRQDMEDLFGPVLLEKRHPILKCWLEKELCATEAILRRLDEIQSGTECIERNPIEGFSECRDGRGQPVEGYSERSPGADFSERRDANTRVRSRKQELLGKERLLQEALSRYSEYSRIKC